MKKILILACLMLIVLTSQSQILISLILGDKLNSDKIEFGLEGGLNWSTLSALETKEYQGNWNLGFYFNFKMNDAWYINTGVLVKSSLGVSNLSDNDMNKLGATIYHDNGGTRLKGKYGQKMSYFLVPVMAKYKFKNNLYAEIGPQFGLMYRSWIQFDYDLDGREAIVKEFNKEKLNKIDAGAVVGIGYRLLKGTGWTIGVKYYYGFIDVYKDIAGSNNSSFFVKMNIPVGTGDKNKGK
ncbi:MAG: PorT family protein [Marinilabiliales bacterium]|nr:MAG: PorT family protein [Marinilabiliales bacterium]